MASRSAIRAARAFVEFSADLSSLPGDFQDAESQFQAFKSRVNKKDALSSVRADLDTRAAEGKLTRLQSQVRDALDPKGAPLLANAGKALDARLSLIEPRIRRLFELPTAKEAAIKKKAEERIASLANAEISSLKYHNDRVNKARAALSAAQKLPRGEKTAAVTAARAELSEASKLLKARESASAKRDQSIREAADREINAYNSRRERALAAYQREYADLVAQRGLIDKEISKIGKAREGQRASTPNVLDQAFSVKSEEASKFSKGLEARLKYEADVAKNYQKQREEAYAEEKKLREKQARDQETGIDQQIRLRKEEAAAFSARLQARLKAEKKVADSQREAVDNLQKRRVAAQNEIAKAELSEEEKRQGRLRRIRKRRRLRDLREQQQQAKRLPTDLAVFGQDLRQVGTGLFAAGAAGLAGFGVAAREFAELDRTLRLIKGIASASGDEMKRLESTVRSLGATTSFTTREVGDAARELARGGQSVAEIQNTLPAVLELSRGTGADLAFSAQAVVRTLGQFQLATTESSRVVDALAASANAGTLDLEDLGESMKFLGPIAETTGESVESIGAAFAVMANNGLRGGLAGRQLRRVFYELANATKQSKIADQLGVEVLDAEGNLRPLIDTVTEIGDALQSLPSGKKVAFLDDIFGEGAAAFEALSKGSKEFRSLIAEVQAAEGYARALAKEVDGGLAGAFLIAVSVARDLGIEIGKALGPALTDILRGLQDAAREAIGWVRENRGLVVSLAAVTATVAGVGAALTALGTGVIVIGAVVSAVNVLRASLIAAQVASIALSKTGLLGVILAVASLGAATQATAGYFDGLVTRIEAGQAVVGDMTDKTYRLIDALQKLTAAGNFETGKGLEKFKNLVAALEQELGPLGARFNETTGAIENAPEVTERAGLLAGLRRKKEEQSALKKEAETLKAEQKSIDESRAELDAQVEKFGLLSLGPAGARAYRQLQKDQDALNEKIEEYNLRFRRAKADVANLKGQLQELGEVEAEAVKNATKETASDASVRGAKIGLGVARSLSPLFDSLLNAGGLLGQTAEKTALKDGFDTDPFTLFTFALKGAADDFNRGDLANAFGSVTDAFNLAGATILTPLRAFGFGVNKEFNDKLRERASELAGKFDLDGLKQREGSFGLFEAQRQAAGQTRDLLADALREEKDQKELLKKIEEHLRKNPGLIGL